MKTAPTTAARLAVIVFSILLVPAPAVAQKKVGKQDLGSAANDPTASLMSFLFQEIYDTSFYNRDGSRNTVQFRAVVPFKLGNTSNIARFTLPYVTKAPSGNTGFADATVFNLTVFERDWGRWGAGVVALLPTGADGVSADKWGVGPAAGFVAQTSWGLAGLFNQNIFTIAGNDDLPDVNISTLEPILDYKLGNGWSVGTSDMTIAYDWDADEFTSLPLGLKLSKLTKPGGVPVQWQLSFERDFYNDGFGPENTVELTAKILLPE